MTGFDPLTTFVHLADDGRATPLEVTPTFWQTLGTSAELRGGNLVSTYHFTHDWTSWERHPLGDELLIQLNGAMDLVLDEAGGERKVALRGRVAFIVPKNVWHTARVLEPSVGIFVTRGDGTEHRPATTR